SAGRIIDDAKALEKAGCFSLVLECIPSPIAKIITEELSIPTIGIGAGPDCDGQVLVTHDLIGLFDRFKPKFVKQYVDSGALILEGLKRFRQEVEEGQFPDVPHSYSMNPEELAHLKKCE
ncbi:MAG TPA: 3-methyl-2-oxobutanoate hydroxymethyltransferase, partial [Candidatus Omnitrophota bacterium]|nr:3-methyl-2-oxobutanoate hydroxymethyltransferase [Candidatus Omnitrophota bacterium]